MIAAGCGVANAYTQVTASNIPQPAGDTLLFALPVDVDVYQHIQNFPDFDPGMRMMKFQPEYLVTSADFAKGDTNKGTATLPANAKVIGLGLDGYDVGSDYCSKGTFLEVTAWCKNVEDGTELNEYDQWFGNGYRIVWNFPDGQLLTDTINCRGYRDHPGYISTFEPAARASNPQTIVDCPFNVKDEEGRNIPFLYTGESIYLTLWMCNWEDIHMKYRYMAFDEADQEVASLMRSGQYCFSSDVVDQIPTYLLSYWYDLPDHRLPAFRTPYFTSDIRITQTDLMADVELWAMNGDNANELVAPAEDGNYYNLDHTKSYLVVVDGKYELPVAFDDMFSDIMVTVNKDMTAVDEIDANKAVASVAYYNLAGQMSEQPVDGVNIVVTTYTDGTRSTAKVIK
jgi:hypothetical protein